MTDFLLCLTIIWNLYCGSRLLWIWRCCEVPVLKPALIWSVCSLGILELACSGSLSVCNTYAAWQDQFWFWAAVTGCCPFISVLGSRRPTSRVWNAFIILPLIAVLGWPALTALWQFPNLHLLQIQLPGLMGFGLVLVMGVGNYQGTRYGLSALTIGLGLSLIVISVSNLIESSENPPILMRAIGALCVAAGVTHGLWQAGRPFIDESRFDRTWFDFRDLFGIVWSIRIQERINQIATIENWSVRLGPEGFHWDEARPEERFRTEERLVHSLYWHLWRFVEPNWIAERLNEPIPESLSSQIK